MSESGEGWRRYVSAAVKLLIAAAVLWAVGQTLERGWREFSTTEWSISVPWLVAAGFFYVAGLLPSAWYWHQILRASGVERRWPEVVRAYFVGHLGKYVPGKALVVVLRTGLLRPGRDELAAVGAAVFYETLTMMATGGMVAGSVLAMLRRDQPWLVTLAIGLMVVSAVPTIPNVFVRVVRWVERWLGQEPREMAWTGLSAGFVARGWLAVSAGWVLIGISLWATVRGFGGGEVATGGVVVEMATCIATSALAVVAGFVSMLPGGIVVRESIVLELLAPQYGAAAALAAAVGVRLLWLVAEVVISTILYFGVGTRVRDAD